MTTPAQNYLYVGCYTNRSPVGIHAFRATGPATRFDLIQEIRDISQSSFLAPHPRGTMMYAVSETNSSEGGGEVAAFAVAADGSLTETTRVPSGGGHPCHLSVDPDGHHLQVANYTSGTVAVYELEPDGRPLDLVAVLELEGSGPTSRQEGPHAHCVVPDPEGRWLYTADLGSDRIIQSSVGQPVAEFKMAPGSGPRHLRFHPALPLLFVVGELDNSLTILAQDPDHGFLSQVVTVSTLPDGWTGESLAADLHLHPSGRIVYVSNRGHDSISIFLLDPAGQSMESIGWVPAGGRTPRGFGLHPSGAAMVVAHQDDDSMSMFRLDPHGAVSALPGHRYRLTEPACVTFLEATP